MIEAKGLKKFFGSNPAVNGVDLQVHAGEIFGFLGPNGAGKTTTIKLLVGLLRPSAGVACIGGHDIQRDPIAAKKIIGYVPDMPHLPEKLSAREFLQFIAGLYEMDRIEARRRSEEWLRLFGLLEHQDELIGAYSYGMRQKTALAGALLHNPKAFFLDEPTVGLDPRSARVIKDVLREIAQRGAAIFMSTHILEIAERMCDRVAIIDHGVVIATGTLEQLQSQQKDESLEDIFLKLTGAADTGQIVAALE